MDQTMTAGLGVQLGVFWVILCAILVSTMQAGFCCLESGLVRAKNSVNVAIKNLVDFCIAALLFWICGYAMMFGDGLWSGVLGWDAPAVGLHPAQADAFFLFQLVFCGTATTIVSGAVAERMRFKGYFIAAAVIAGLIYPVTGHWAWAAADGGSPGWLQAMGFHDFAGSTVVHAVGGWTALAAIMVLGPRLGRFTASGKGIEGHDLPVAVLGVFLLWFGWFGFNGGSTLALTDSVPRILVNTALGGAAGGLTALLTTWAIHRLPRVPLIMNGVIAGLVGVTAGCDHMALWAAAVSGGIGGVLCTVVCLLLDRTSLDDAVGAVPAHLVGGIWGTLAVALFGTPEAWASGAGRWEQLGIQGLGVTVIGLYAFTVSYGVLWLVNRLDPLRVTAEEERIGLNISEHGTCTSTQELLARMVEHGRRGDFTQAVEVEADTEVAPIAVEYNRVLDKVNEVTHRLRDSERQTRSVLDNAAMPMLIVRPGDGEVLYLNARARLAFQVEVGPGETLHDHGLWGNAAGRFALVHAVETMGSVSDLEATLRTARGETFPALVSAVRMRYQDEDCLCLSLADLSSRKAMEEQLRLMAATDALTGLLNRRGFMARGKEELSRSRRFGHPLSLIMLDADRFKAINDTHGHAVGDSVLMAVAEVARGQLRDIDLLGRLGGEEFAILVPETDLVGGAHLAERLRHALAEASVVLPAGGVLTFTASFGVAEMVRGDHGMEDLLRRADAAMYQAKAQGRNRVCLQASDLALMEG